MQRSAWRILGAAGAACACSAVLCAALTGCAGPGPSYERFDSSPAVVKQAVPSGAVRVYRSVTAEAGGRMEYVREAHGKRRLLALRFDFDGDGTIDRVVDRRDPQRPVIEPPAREHVRHLIVIVDSVPFDLLRAAHADGGFPLFFAPAEVIAPFPAMTDPALNELFGTSPALGVESLYFDGTRMSDGMGCYNAERNMNWLAGVDWHLSPRLHGPSYLFPRDWFAHELGEIQRAFDASGNSAFCGYVVSTSGLGMQYGAAGHAFALRNLEWFCETMMYRAGGLLQITLLSDHGHTLQTAQRVDLAAYLEQRGFHASERLESDRDVVVPAFGLVSCAAVSTRAPAAVAAALVEHEAVEVAAYRDGDRVVALTPDGRCSIPIEGDSPGEAGVLHEYPRARARLRRAFDGLFEHPPDVLVSLAEGYCHGSGAFAGFMHLRGIHGSLRRSSSAGFAMTTCGPLPKRVSTAELGAALRGLGVPVYNGEGAASSLRAGGAAR